MTTNKNAPKSSPEFMANPFQKTTTNIYDPNTGKKHEKKHSYVLTTNANCALQKTPYSTSITTPTNALEKNRTKT
jgi:hypothetical protein